MKRRRTAFIVALAGMLGIGVLAAPSASASTSFFYCRLRGGDGTVAYRELATFHIGSNRAGTSHSIMDIQWTETTWPVVYIQVKEGYDDSNFKFVSLYEFSSNDSGHTTGSRATGLPNIRVNASSPQGHGRVGYLRITEYSSAYGYWDCDNYVNF
jgi:hypothetical protein